MATTGRKRRAKGAGSIFKRGNAFSLKYTVEGRVQVVPLTLRYGITTRAEAEKKARELLQPVANLKTVESIAQHVADARRLILGEKVIIGDWRYDEDAKSWIPDGSWAAFKDSPTRPDCTDATLENYATYWKAFTNWLRGHHPEIVKVTQIDATTAKEYATALGRRDITPRTYNAHLQGLRLVCRVIEAGMSGNPFGAIEGKIETRMGRESISKEKAWEILCSLANPDLDIPNRAETRVLWAVGFCCGFRLGDAVMLRWKSIDMARGFVRIIPQKTRNRRPTRTKGEPPSAKVPITPVLTEAFEEAQKWDDDSGFVMPKLAASFLKNRNAVDRGVCRVLDKVGLTERHCGGKGIERRKYGYHSCRHFFCSECANAGVQMTALAAMTGDRMDTLQNFYMHDDEGSANLTSAALALSPEGREQSVLLDQIVGGLRALPLEQLRQIAETVQSGKKKKLEDESEIAPTNCLLPAVRKRKKK